MNIEELRIFALSLPGVTEELPFDDNTLVFKVGGKMFLLFSIIPFEFIIVKCDPEKAIELRQEYTAVEPGYHCNKKHWNSIYPHRDANDELILEWIQHSYDLVYSALSKKIKATLES